MKSICITFYDCIVEYMYIDVYNVYIVSSIFALFLWISTYEIEIIKINVNFRSLVLRSSFPGLYFCVVLFIISNTLSLFLLSYHYLTLTEASGFYDWILFNFCESSLIFNQVHVYWKSGIVYGWNISCFHGWRNFMASHLSIFGFSSIHYFF